MTFDARFGREKLLAIGAREGENLGVEFSQVLVEVALQRKGRGANLTLKGSELKMDSIYVPLEGSGMSKNTRALETRDRGGIVVVFDNLLWMKFVNVVGELHRCFEARIAVLARMVE